MLFWIAVILMLCTVVAIVVWPLIREQQDSREKRTSILRSFATSLPRLCGSTMKGVSNMPRRRLQKRKLAAHIGRRYRPPAAVARNIAPTGGCCCTRGDTNW